MRSISNAKILCGENKASEIQHEFKQYMYIMQCTYNDMGRCRRKYCLLTEESHRAKERGREGGRKSVSE